MDKEPINRSNGRTAGDGRPALAREGGPVQESLIWGGVAAIGLFALYAVSAGVSFWEIIFLAGLSALCVAPILRWYLRGMEWIPLGEVFALLHLVYYVMPCLMKRPDWLIYAESQRLTTLTAVALFLAAFLAVYQAILRRPWKSLEGISMLRREIPLNTMWTIFGLWILATLLRESSLLLDLGVYTNVYYSIMNALGAMAVAYLFYQIGRGKLSFGQRAVVIGGFSVGMAVSFANGYLSGNAQTLGAALLAYTLGRKQIPVGIIALSVVLLTIMQLGKTEYRATFWGKSAHEGGQTPSLAEGYKIWLNAGWKNLVTPGNEKVAKSQGVLERASLIQVLARAMNDTPAEKPFLYGETYLMFPEELVPRMFWPDKPRGSLPAETIGIYYGIQTEKGAQFTGISVGQLTEAWANFGWCGLVASGSFLGLIFGLAARVSLKLVPSQVGWLLAAIVLSYSLKLETCVPELSSSLLQALLAAAVLLFVFSRPPIFISRQKKLWTKVRRPIPFKPVVR